MSEPRNLLCVSHVNQACFVQENPLAQGKQHPFFDDQGADMTAGHYHNLKRL